jgi:hypothetical protein
MCTVTANARGIEPLSSLASNSQTLTILDTILLFLIFYLVSWLYQLNNFAVNSMANQSHTGPNKKIRSTAQADTRKDAEKKKKKKKKTYFMRFGAMLAWLFT